MPYTKITKSLIFISIIFLGLFIFCNSGNSQTYFNPSIIYGSGYGIYGPTSWRNPGADFLASYGISSYPTGTPYYPYSYQPYNDGLYHGNPYNPSDPLYGTVPPPPISIPSEIMNMLSSSRYSPNEPDMSYIGYQLSLPYFQAAAMSGWPPYRYQQPYNYYGYEGYVSGGYISGYYNPSFGYQQRFYPSYPYPGIPYGSDMVGYP